MHGEGFARAEKGINLVILNGDMDDKIRITKLLETPGLLIYRLTKTVKHEIKKARRQIYWQCY